jgi:GTP-binding protein
MFVDHIKIYAKAGKGGDGSASFRREKFIPRGGPDGGDGGKGADIIFRVDPHVNSLQALFFQPNLRAEDGKKGQGKKCYGRAGKDLLIKVPAGTLVYRMKDAPAVPVGSVAPEAEAEGSFFIDDEEEESVGRSLKKTLAEEDLELVADLTELETNFILARGGKGGKGNVHFKTPTHRAPTETKPGDEAIFYLELRQIADVGLVGFPNAGKSTILSKMSAAKPKIAAYPFTTLKPMVGVIEYSEKNDYQRVTLADIPGLIEGAHENIGLGHDFLRHILRCRTLLFVVDAAGSEGRDPCADIATLRQEIVLYDKLLAKRPWLIVANKIDLPEADENVRSLKERFPKVKILAISANEGTGLEALREEMRVRTHGKAKSKATSARS